MLFRSLVTTWGGNEYAWGSPTVIGLAAAGLGLIGLFILQERRAVEPIIPMGLFKSGVFRVASAIGFFIGLAMFGAIIFIPLFLQLVYKVSPTSSGLRLLPLMGGLLVTVVISGRMISRTGRYKIFPILGTAITALGMFLLSTLGLDTPPWVASVYMLVVGIGIGLVMQVVVLVIQNSAAPSDVGVATSTATFFRSMGGSLGVALFGAIFASRLADQLAAIPGAAAKHLPTGSHISAAEVHALPAAAQHIFLMAFVNALQPVFLAGAVLAAFTFLLALMLKEVPLRATTHDMSELSAEEGIVGASPPQVMFE